MEEDLAGVGSSFPGCLTVKKADLSKPEYVFAPLVLDRGCDELLEFLP